MKVHSKKIGLASAIVTVALLSGSTVLALPSQANVHAQDTGSGTSTDTTSQSGSKLTDVHLRVCQNRQNAINNILSKIVLRGTNQLDLFNTIAQRVETFKTDKNLTVANYDQLIATLQSDQTKATTDLATMKANDTLDCSSTDPKGMVTAFQADLKTEISDLKTYKTDVNNLIVAVKSSVGTSKSSTSSSTTGGN